MKSHDTKQIPPPEISPAQLFRLILRYNFGYGLFGAVVLFLAACCWSAIFFLLLYWVTFLDPFEKWPMLSLFFGRQNESYVFLAVVTPMVLLIGGIGLRFCDQFLVVRYDDRFPMLRCYIVWDFAPPSIERFIFSPLFLAPILTCWGLTIFRECLPINREMRNQAAVMYRHLAVQGDWISYPPLESQRQAVVLLYHLGLVRISRRFGRLQVKQLGAGPKRRMAKI